MFNFDGVSLERIVVHNVGNKSKEEGSQFSNGLMSLDDDLIRDLLLKYFLSSFKSDAFYQFTHDSDVNLNEVYHYVDQVFENPDQFYDQSVNIAKHLYEASTHNKIKGGEFYVAYFTDIIIEDELADAVGLFKSENKDTYLRVYQQNNNFNIDYADGININKLDKGCLIFNTEKEHGYKVCIIDNLNKSNQAHYWRDDFLRLKAYENNFYHTQNYLNMCKDFVQEVFNDENEVEKPDQIALLNKSVEYFKDKEVFVEEEFEQEVMQKPEVVEAFREYKHQYQEQLKEEGNTDVKFEEFEISSNAVKDSKKFFRSVLKLDKNFSVYIHGNRDYVVKGFDQERQMNFYQFFYNEEESK
ncbi:hypothetical protein BKI52_16240 [marine bacterium AO1-C]|nr:hypothetical protein BKI52_16240 [marine bacterium AO1-C]